MKDSIRIFSILYDQSDFTGRAKTSGLESRLCEWQDCTVKAVHKTPKTPRKFSQTLWLCRLHAREHNANWDYFEGMNQEQIDHFRHNDITWHLPTWKLNPNNDTRWVEPHGSGEWIDLDDLFGPAEPGSHTDRARDNNDISRKALMVFQLDRWATWDDIKAQYKVLVKRHHPDANGGCKNAENRLKQVNHAYGVLKNWYEQ